MQESGQQKSPKREWICQNTHGAEIKPALQRNHESIYKETFCRRKTDGIVDADQQSQRYVQNNSSASPCIQNMQQIK